MWRVASVTCQAGVWLSLTIMFSSACLASQQLRNTGMNRFRSGGQKICGRQGGWGGPGEAGLEALERCGGWRGPWGRWWGLGRPLGRWWGLGRPLGEVVGAGRPLGGGWGRTTG